MIYLKDFMDLKGLEKRIHRDCLFLWSFDVFHYDLRGDSLGVWAKWQRGLLKLIVFEGGYIGIACFYGVPMYSFLGYIGIWCLS